MESQRVMAGRVYLGGPIGGLSWDEATGWRDMVSEQLKPLTCYSPLRPMNGVSQLVCNPTFNEHMSDQQTLPFSDFFNRDYTDVSVCDLLFFNFVGAKRKSIGSACEIARGYAQKKGMICVMERGNVNEDVFLLAHFERAPNTLRVHTLQDGVDAVKKFFPLGWDKLVTML